MSFRLFDLDPIYERMECFEGVTYNGEDIALCFKECGYGPREIIDDPYWKEYVKYIYHLQTQRLFNFPDLMIATKSKDLLNIQLTRYRFDLLGTETHAEEYAEIWKIAMTAAMPEIKLKNMVGTELFDYFVCDYNNAKITFIVGQEKYEGPLDEAEIEAFRYVEDRLGPENALDSVNRQFITEMPFPKKLKKDSEEVYTNLVESHKRYLAEDRKEDRAGGREWDNEDDLEEMF